MSTSQTSKEEVSTIGGAEAKPSGVSRRKFLGGVGGAAAVMAAGGLGIEPLVKGGSAAHADIGPQGANQRATSCWKFRKDAADFNRKTSADHADNGDEARYANKIGSCSKGLPHNSFGEVDPGAYGALINALSSGAPRDFDNLVLGSTSPFAKQTNPQSGLALDLQGSHSHALAEPAPPALASAEGAGE